MKPENALRWMLPLALLGALACATPPPLDAKAAISAGTRAKSALQGMIIGAVVGGQIGGLPGAAAGSALLGAYGLVKGEPFYSASARRAEAGAVLEREIDEEIARREAIEAEAEADAARQGEQASANGEREAPGEPIRDEARECGGSGR